MSEYHSPESEPHNRDSSQASDDVAHDEGYADSTDQEPPTLGLIPAVLPAILGFLGMSLCLWAVRPLRDGVQIEVASGLLISVIVVVGILVLLGVQTDRFLGLVGRGTVLPMLLGFLTMGLILTPISLFQQPVAELPPWPVAGIGVALLIASIIVYLRQWAITKQWVHLTLAITYPAATVLLLAITWTRF